MVYEVEINARIYVSVEVGGEDSARAVARDRVANDWLLRETEGASRGVGHYVVKGLSAEVGSVKPFIGNRRISKSPEGEIF